MANQSSFVRELIYLDAERVRTLAAQFDLKSANELTADRVALERLLADLEPLLLERPGTARIDSDFDFSQWKPDTFADCQFALIRGVVRLMDYNWLTLALSGLPAVLRKMNKIEMAALRNSDEGRRMSKTQIQQRSQENQAAIAKIEEFKIEELGDVIRRLYGDIVRVKIRPSPEYPQAILVGSAYVDRFYDSPAALNQKYGIEIDAKWTILGQLNIPGQTSAIQPMPVGNQMEDSFEQLALLMNNAFRLANGPAFPALSMTPVAIYRSID